MIFPGTFGDRAWADYLLCDRHVAPPDLNFAYPVGASGAAGGDDEEAGAAAAAGGACPEALRRGGEAVYAEKLVYLPNSYQVRHSVDAHTGRHKPRSRLLAFALFLATLHAVLFCL